MNLTEFNQSDSCDHLSCPERSVSPAVYILMYMCSAAVVLLTVCGNLLIIISILHFKQLHTPTNMLLLSLAVSDFLLGALVMPPVFIWTIKSCWIFGRDFCIRSERKAAKVLGILVSVFLVCLLPFYINEKHPIAPSLQLLPVLPACVKHMRYCWGDLLDLKQRGLSIQESQPFDVEPHSSVFTKLQQYRFRWGGGSLRGRGRWDGFHFIRAIEKAHLDLIPRTCRSFGKMVVGREICISLICLNSTINPVIYALFYLWFRRSVKLIITLQIFQTNSAIINVLS
ncbi:trace amine-associated receptor 1-like [Tachysurus fulvidraco]|uniref:trace amine-associated receptor 1-like n=1 Tax=Tachysurus fulvidraco TaxID=1234273 RepID=UPI001FEDDB2D|nr:trace amine-associated receptor 1-like [Tachysurus fulvidraco]